MGFLANPVFKNSEVKVGVVLVHNFTEHTRKIIHAFGKVKIQMQ